MVLIVAVLAVSLGLAPYVRGEKDWEYDGDLGPENWHTRFSWCGGNKQSPININNTNVVYDSDLLPFDLSEYDSCGDCSMKLENVNGHTVEVKYSGDPITIRGGSLPDEYILDQLHFHWGGSNNVGSEHLLDDQAAPLEMHVVHHKKTKDLKSQTAANPDDLAVLSFLFKLGDHNSKFDQFLLSHFDDVMHEDDHVDLEPFSLSELLPENTDHYYRYFGSLTTPPCSEAVVWSVFMDRIEISQAQLQVFRSLTAVRTFGGQDFEVPLVNNYRPEQRLFGRRVTSNVECLGQDCDD